MFKAKILLINILTCWICGSMLACSESNSSASKKPKQEIKEAVILAPKERFDMSLVKEGDFIMKNGYGRISDVITKALKEEIEISHCGIIVIDSNRAFVIQSMLSDEKGANGIQKLPLSKFLFEMKRDTVYLLRHRSSDKERAQIANQARRLFKKSVPFDSEFVLHDSSAFYCSELIDHILQEVYDTTYFETKIVYGTEMLLFNSLLDTTVFEQIPFRLKYNPQ